MKIDTFSWTQKTFYDFVGFNKDWSKKLSRFGLKIPTRSCAIYMIVSTPPPPPPPPTVVKEEWIEKEETPPSASPP
jgi:hypothetical protein